MRGVVFFLLDECVVGGRSAVTQTSKLSNVSNSLYFETKPLERTLKLFSIMQLPNECNNDCENTGKRDAIIEALSDAYIYNNTKLKLN